MNFLTQEIRQQIKNQLEPLTDSNINDIETAEGRICVKKNAAGRKSGIFPETGLQTD